MAGRGKLKRGEALVRLDTATTPTLDSSASDSQLLASATEGSVSRQDCSELSPTPSAPLVPKPVPSLLGSTSASASASAPHIKLSVTTAPHGLTRGVASGKLIQSEKERSASTVGVLTPAPSEATLKTHSGAVSEDEAKSVGSDKSAASGDGDYWKKFAKSTRKKLRKMLGIKLKKDLIAEEKELELRKQQLREQAQKAFMAKHAHLLKPKPKVGRLASGRLREVEALLKKKEFAPSAAREHLGRPIKQLSTRRIAMVEEVLKNDKTLQAMIKESVEKKAELKEKKAESAAKEALTASQKFDKALLSKVGEKIQFARNKSQLLTEDAFVEAVSGAVGSAIMELDDSEAKKPDEDLERLLTDHSDATVTQPPSVNLENLLLEAELRSEIVETPEDQGPIFANIDVIVDSILENAEELTEFSMDGHPFFEALPLGSEERKAMCEMLAEAFAYNSHYTVISLNNCALSDEFVYAMCDWISKGRLQQLKVLKLKGNSISNAGIQSLATTLEMGFSIGTISASSSDDVLEQECPLQELIISDQTLPLSEDTEYALAAAMKVNRKIRKLVASVKNEECRSLIASYLSRNRKDSDGLDEDQREKLLPPLEARVRRIRTNRETAEDGDILEVENELAFKILGKNEKLGLAKGLRTNTTLRMLRLTGVDLDDEWACALANSLVDNQCLDFLDLSGNRFTVFGVAAIMASLALNRSIKHLDLKNQLVSPDGSSPLSAESSPATKPKPRASSEVVGTAKRRSVVVATTVLEGDDEAETLEALEQNDKIITISGVEVGSAEGKIKILGLIQRNCLAQLKDWAPSDDPKPSDDDDD